MKRNKGMAALRLRCFVAEAWLLHVTMAADADVS